MAEVAFLGRQPIVRGNLESAGCEVQFWAQSESGLQENETVATAHVVLNTFVEFGLDHATRGRRAFIKASRAFVVDGYAQQLPREHIVIEIPEHVEPDAETLLAVRMLCANGYALALDNYRPDSPAGEFVVYAGIATLDLRHYPVDALSDEVARLTDQGLQVVIKGVETEEAFSRGKALGVDLFQGAYLSPLVVLSQPRRSPSRTPTLRLLALLSTDDAPLSDLERAIGADAVLSHKLLRVLSSAAFGFHSPVESLRQAILLLGRQQIRMWATLIALVGFGSGADVVMTVLWRAQMCRILADRVDRSRQDVYFTTGLLSTLDRLLGMSMAEVVASLSLADDLSAALLHRAGRVGEVLAAVEAYEACDWDRARCRDLSPDDMRTAWTQALRWSREIDRFLRG